MTVTPICAPSRLAIGRNTLILLGANLASAGFGLLLSILIARGWGDAALGTYSLALAWNLTLAQLADLGLNTLLTRDLAQRPADSSRYLGASLAAKTVLGVLLVAGLVLAAPAFTRDASTALALKLGSALIVLNAWYSSFTAVFRAFGRMTPILVLNGGGLFAQTVFTLWLLANRFDVNALILLAVIVQAAQLGAAALLGRSAAIGAQRRCAPTVPGDAWRLDVRFTLKLLRAGLPFALAGILAGIEMRLNILLLGAMQGDRAVGWYAAAARLQEGLRLAPNAFFGALLPALAALSANAPRVGFAQTFHRAQQALLLFAFAAALGCTLLAQPLIIRLYGDAFSPAIPVLMILSWGLIPALLSGLLILKLYARGEEGAVNLLLGVGLAVQAVLAPILIRTLGVTGAAFASVASDLVLLWLLRQRAAKGEKGEQGVWQCAQRLLAPLILFGLALLPRLGWIAAYGFDGLYGQDAYAYYEYARAEFDAWREWRAPPPFWWPLGYPTLINFAFALTGATIFSAQWITVLCGALVAPSAYLLTKEAAPREYANLAAWLAGAIVAVGAQLAQSSVVIMADAPALLWTTLAAWLLLRYRRMPRAKGCSVGTSLLASLAVGMAIWTRWQNLIFGGVWFAALAWAEYRSGVEKWQGTKRMALAAGLGALVLLPQIVYQIMFGAALAGQSWLEGWSPANFFARTFDTVDGHFDYALPVAVFYAQVFFHPAYLAFPLTPFFMVGVGTFRQNVPTPRATGRVDLTPVILLLGWCATMYLFLAGIPYENFRFGLGFFVPVAVLAGIGAAYAWHAQRERIWRGALALIMLASLTLMLAWHPRVLRPILDLKRRELEQVAWLQSQIPAQSLLYTMGVDGAVRVYSSLRVENIWNKSAAEILHTPAYLFIDVENLETQWRGRAPEQLYRQLRAAGVLRKVGESQGWTLFGIEH